MELIHVEIELINVDDLALVRRKMIGEDEVKRMKITVLVNSGAIMLCINENIQEQLQLPVLEKRKFRMENGSPLLGAIALEDMDILIHPQRQELIVNPDHPYFAQVKLKECALIE